MKIKFIIAMFGILIFGANGIFADWDPEYCLINEDKTRLKLLNDPIFSLIKKHVTNYLAKSWCSAEKTNMLMELIMIEKPQLCVEVGAFTGSSVLPVAATLKYLKKGKVYAIDAWSNAIATRNMENDDPNKVWWSNINMNKIYSKFERMIRDWSLQSCCFAIHQSSENAIAYLEQIDFLHLDGDYSELGSVKDVEMYLPKVKSGGYILFSNINVSVNGKFTKLNAYNLLYDACEYICDIENEDVVLFRKY